MVLDPVILAALLRHLQAFQSLHESEGTDSLQAPGGDLYCLADLWRLYEMRLLLGTPADLAIEALFLDLSDADAARHMGISSRADAAACTLASLGRLCEIFGNGLWEGGNERAASRGKDPRGQAAPAPWGVPPAGGRGDGAHHGVTAGGHLALCQV
jgi:hypothetical protein